MQEHGLRTLECQNDTEAPPPTRLVNKCMSTHLNANAKVSLDSNANAMFQERMQMQNVFGSHSNANALVTHLEMHLNYFQMFGYILTICFIWRKKTVMYTNTLLIYFINIYKHIIYLFNKYSSTLL